MATSKDLTVGDFRRNMIDLAVRLTLGVTLVASTVGSAILVKEQQFRGMPLAMVTRVSLDPGADARLVLASDSPVAAVDNLGNLDKPGEDLVPADFALVEPEPRSARTPDVRIEILGAPVTGTTDEVEMAETAPSDEVELDARTLALAQDSSVRWFNGRPVRPARQMWMVVTGYSPDERSCGDSADGLTATLHSVETNGHQLVAADPRVLKYGSMLTVDGYADNSIVPVLDCGGAIKGRRLDLLFPTHEQARKWGRQRILVTVWEFADGKPADCPRKLR